MIAAGLLTTELTHKHEVYFLTTDGVDIVKELIGMDQYVFDPKKKRVRRGYFWSSELLIIPRNINHQIMLNQFYIDFIKNIDIEHKYYDEKYITDFIDIRPDGLIKVGEVDYFIETDMNTEGTKQLREKWSNYRRFLTNNRHKHKKIVVLFQIENAANPKTRITLVKNSVVKEIIDLIGDDFDIVVDTRENLIKYLKRHLIEKRETLRLAKEELEGQGFYFKDGDELSKYVGGTKFKYYLRKLNPDATIKIEENRVQEYVMDSYLDKEMHVINHMYYLLTSNQYYKEIVGRNLPLIVLCNDLKETYEDLKSINMLGLKNVYFTTFERLQKYEFYEALTQIDEYGCVINYTDMGLSNCKLLCKIEDL